MASSSATHFDSAVDNNKVHMLFDLERLERESKQRLKRTDTGILRALFTFLETRVA